MAVEDEVPDVEAFDRPDLALPPETHQAQAEMAAERGEEYDPYEVEQPARARAYAGPDPLEAAEPVE